MYKDFKWYKVNLIYMNDGVTHILVFQFTGFDAESSKITKLGSSGITSCIF